jgi:myo-inositol 2-dehydrogenase/D-chiro-inositol 1-dehydrogenase
MAAYAEEMRQFVACLVEDKQPPVSGMDGRIPVVMGLAAWKSYQENRPVKVSEVAAS